MVEHPAIRSRTENVLFVGFAGRSGSLDPGAGDRRTCRYCAHWCGDEAGDGRCLADCGARAMPAQGRCGEWRRPPLLIVV
ncbi:MAG: hypothetical protein AB7I59_02045 [Geminicoccaceae bacterium]